MGKSWVVKDTDQYFYRQGVRRATRGMPFVDEKNPARAYSFSLFFWGTGQTYAGLRMRGVLFQLMMVLVLIGVGFSLLFGKELLVLLRAEGVLNADIFLWLEVLFFGAACFWSYNAIDAYHASARGRRVPFRGVENTVLPMLSSLLVPGWGQFMNGQPFKGSLLSGFAVLNLFCAVTIPAVLFFWPFLEPAKSRVIIETVFAGAVLYTPVIPLMAVLSGHDALKVSLDDTKKELILDRIAHAIIRIRIEGWGHRIFSLARSSAVIALVLASFLVARNHYHFPVNFYSVHLIETRAWLQKQGMTIVPGLIDKVLSTTAGGTVIGKG